MADKKLVLNIQIPAQTDKQLQEIVAATGYTKTQLIVLLIDREYQQRNGNKSKPIEKGSSNE